MPTDHQLHFSCREPAIQEKNTDGKKKTSEWYNENFLKGNLSKYQTMIISKQESDFLDVVIDGMTIKATDYHHYMCHYCSQPSLPRRRS